MSNAIESAAIRRASRSWIAPLGSLTWSSAEPVAVAVDTVGLTVDLDGHLDTARVRPEANGGLQGLLTDRLQVLRFGMRE